MNSCVLHRYGSPVNARSSDICAPLRNGPSDRDNDTAKERIQGMVYAIAVVLVILWLLGIVTSYTMGGFVHVLLVIAVVVVLYNMITGRKPA